MKQNFLKRFFMPYTTGPACTIEAGCGEPDFPQTTAVCVCTPATGGINELYFIPCTATFSEANVLDTAWWQAFITAGTLGRSGVGLGSIGKKNQRNERYASCRTEQITSLTWALRFVQKCFDKTAARSTQKKFNELITNFDKYLVVARMCDGSEDILPIGQFEATDINWTVPDNFEENQSLEIELSWREFGVPTPVTVAGLAAILPKLK